MRWLFVTGIALDVSGALMVVGALLRARPGEVAKEAVSYVGYSEAILRARVEERRYAFGGAGLLALGFVCQLVGYSWEFGSSWWLLGYAFGVAVTAFVVVLWASRRIGTRFYDRAERLMRKAVQ